MPADLPPSEFGGKVQDNTIQGRSPNGEFIHQPTASERLRLTYVAGVPADSDDDVLAPRDEFAFTGGEWVPEGYRYNRRKKVWEEDDD